MADLPGEVDLIVADTAEHRLWVCEVKDPEGAFAPAALGRHIERFTRRWPARRAGQRGDGQSAPGDDSQVQVILLGGIPDSRLASLAERKQISNINRFDRANELKA
jgi:hypothetical protein